MRLISLALVIGLCQLAHSQTDNAVVNNFIERYIENSEDEIDIQQFADELLYFYNNPIDLNKATSVELFNTPFLTANQSREIIQHRKEFGDFIEIYELQVLPSFSIGGIQNVLPFVQIKEQALSKLRISDVFRDGEHMIMSLVESQAPKKRGVLIADTASPSFDGNKYDGSPLYANFRYRFDYKNKISFGFCSEKDAGESFLTDNQPFGFDYYTGYFSMQNMGKLKRLQLGDFKASFGQGLTLATGLAFGKSSIITNAKRNSKGFGPYRSLRENAYLRGGAVAFDLGKIETGVFLSYKNIDGNGIFANDTTSNEIVGFTSIQEDGGLHRTASEILDKNTLTDIQTGGYVQLNTDFGTIGTIHHLRNFSQPLTPNFRPDNAFQFSGNQYSKHGLYYDLVAKNMNLFGEASYASNGSFAAVAGLLASAGRKLDLSLVYRNYGRDFIGMQSVGFGESAGTTNEQGLYLGFEMRPTNQFKILGYYDLYKSNWLRFSADGLSSGNDLWLEANYKPRRSWEVYYRYRTETKQRNTVGDQINTLAFYTLQRHRVHSSLTIDKKVTLRTRAEWNTYTQEGLSSRGSLIYQDVIYKPFGSFWHISYRIAASRIEDFNNRIYSFEQVPLYDYPMHNHFYSGIRSYVLLRLLPTRNFNLWFKYGFSHFEQDLNSLDPSYTVGSGLEQTEGPNRHIFTLQLRYKIR